jgi:hypothetical protein
LPLTVGIIKTPFMQNREAYAAFSFGAIAADDRRERRQGVSGLVRLGHSAMLAQCPVCPKAGIAADL